MTPEERKQKRKVEKALDGKRRQHMIMLMNLYRRTKEKKEVDPEKFKTAAHLITLSNDAVEIRKIFTDYRDWVTVRNERKEKES